MEKKNKYPGFLEGFKASNISVNMPSLASYSSQIKKQLSILENDINASEEIKDDIKKAISIIDETMEYSQSPNNIINSYIKFGTIFDDIISDSNFANVVSIGKITLDYLNVARIAQDSRISDLALELGRKISDKG